jgi:hypothetical protein
MNGPQILYHVTTDYRGGWLVIGPAGYAKREDDFCTAHALATRLNEQHRNVLQLADALVAQHLTPRQP